MKYTSAILLLLALICVVQAGQSGGNPAKKRSISMKRESCFYNNTFTGACESLQTYLDRNSEWIPPEELEFLDVYYHSIYPQSVPHRDDNTLNVAHGVTYPNGLCPGNSNYTMRIFVIRGHVLLGFWPELSTCIGWVLDNRNTENGRQTFPFFRETYHAVGQPGLGNITDYYTIGVVNIEDVRNHLADLDDTDTYFSKQAYDALDNNCGRVIVSAILSTGNYLSFPIKSFVAERLVQEPQLNKMFSHPTNLLSLWPELTPAERAALSNATRTTTVYKYQQNKNQVNHPSCDFSVLSTVTRNCVGEIQGPEFGGSNPEAWGPGYERHGTFCEFSWSDTELTTACGTITRTFKSVNLRDEEIIKTQSVVVACAPPTLTCPSTQIVCPAPTDIESCGSPIVSIQNSLAVTRYAVTDLCGVEYIFDCENTCQPL